MKSVLDSLSYGYYSLIDYTYEVLYFIQYYGWFLLAGAILAYYIFIKIEPRYKKWKEQMEDAAYHKDPDRALRRMEEIQRARDKQQRELEAAAIVYAEKQKEFEEKKKREALERLEKGRASSGQKLGTGVDDYLPLAGGASTSTYRAPKKKCPGGGCGRS